MINVDKLVVRGVRNSYLATVSILGALLLGIVATHLIIDQPAANAQTEQSCEERGSGRCE